MFARGRSQTAPTQSNKHRIKRPSRMRWSFLLFSRECEGHFEQISVHGHIHITMLQLHQALGNVQTQAAAFRIAGSIATDKPFRQFLGGDIQFLPGDIFNGTDYPSAFGR